VTGWLRRYRNPIWIATTLALLLTIVGGGGYLFTSRDFSDSVAVVGGVKIPYIYYRRLVDRNLDAVRKEKKDVTDEMTKEVKQAVFTRLVTTQISAIEAKAMGMQVSDEEIALIIQHDPQFQSNGAFNQPLYLQTVIQEYNMSVEEFERQFRIEILAEKYRNLIANTVKFVPDEVLNEYKRTHSGSTKDFKKDSDKFAQKLHQVRMLSTLQADLGRAAIRLGFQNFLLDREPGQQ
jgi:hypothetical protein